MILQGPSDLTDEELVRRTGEGDTAAFDELYDRYSQRLLRYFRRMLGGDSDKAEDFLQDAFLKVIEKHGHFDPAKRFSTWIFALVHHMCCNELRRQEVRQNTTRSDVDALVPDVGERSYGVEDEVEDRLFRQALVRELNRLDEVKRSTFLVRFQEEFSLKEISAMLDCSIGTTKSRLFYTCQTLADRLRAYDPSNTLEGAEER